MSSIAQYHFPRFIWRKTEKLLWNPIHRKALKNQPEERVRLRVIEALMAAGWSKHRISTEETLDSSRRTDLICYDQDFNPKILIECKAENVPITTKVAEQTARYNHSVNAPFLLMSNGLSDFWYRITNNKTAERLSSPPDLLKLSNQNEEKEFSYWKERGFSGENATSPLRNWITALLNIFWQTDKNEIRFIPFNNSPSNLNLEHYFHISKIGQNKIAFGIMSTPFGGTHMIAVINREGQNIGLLELNLDLLAAGDYPNGTIYSLNDMKNFNLLDFLPLEFHADPNPEDLLNLPSSMNDIFSKLTD